MRVIRDIFGWISEFHHHHDVMFIDDGERPTLIVLTKTHSETSLILRWKCHKVPNPHFACVGRENCRSKILSTEEINCAHETLAY
jgi:hypothetical protein